MEYRLTHDQQRTTQSVGGLQVVQISTIIVSIKVNEQRLIDKTMTRTNGGIVSSL